MISELQALVLGAIPGIDRVFAGFKLRSSRLSSMAVWDGTILDSHSMSRCISEAYSHCSSTTGANGCRWRSRSYAPIRLPDAY